VPTSTKSQIIKSAASHKAKHVTNMIKTEICNNTVENILNKIYQ